MQTGQGTKNLVTGIKDCAVRRGVLYMFSYLQFYIIYTGSPVPPADPPADPPTPVIVSPVRVRVGLQSATYPRIGYGCHPDASMSHPTQFSRGQARTLRMAPKTVQWKTLRKTRTTRMIPNPRRVGFPTPSCVFQIEKDMN